MTTSGLELATFELLELHLSLDKVKVNTYCTCMIPVTELYNLQSIINKLKKKLVTMYKYLLQCTNTDYNIHKFIDQESWMVVVIFRLFWSPSEKELLLLVYRDIGKNPQLKQ